MPQLEIVNTSSHTQKHVPVVHADGKLDEVSVGPFGKVSLVEGMTVSPSFSDKDIVVRDKVEPKKQELVINHSVPAAAPAPAPAPDKAGSKKQDAADKA